MPLATMADAHREWHRNAGVPMGTPGCPEDACHLPDDDRWWEDEPEPVYLVSTPYGTVTHLTYEQAKTEARQAAAITGRACKVAKI